MKPKQDVAEFEVAVAADRRTGTARKLLKPSGLAAYDAAVERAIRRCDPFPRLKEGAMPRKLQLTSTVDSVEARSTRS